MSKRGELAIERKHHGHNCAQAIACTYADCVGADEELLYMINQGFGGGLGGMEGESKTKTAGEMKRITGEFKERNSSVICKDLKGLKTGKMLRSCDDCVRDVCEFIEEYLDIK